MACWMTSGTLSAAEKRRPLSVQQPMYIFHIDVWNGADPQKIIDLVPEDMRPYVVMNISLSVSQNVTKDGMRTAESWLRTCAENRVWALIQPASGGHSWFSDYDLSVYRYFFENYPNFLGFNYCEQFWGFDDADGLHPFGPKSPTVADRMSLFTNLLPLCEEFGGYLAISNCMVIPEWDATSPLTMLKRYPGFAAAAKKYSSSLIYLEKYTTAANFYDMESECLGLYLAGYSGHYGMRFDQCGYTEHIPSDAKFPEAIGGMTILEHMMMTGQTVQDGPELIWQQCVKEGNRKDLADGYRMRTWEFYPQYPNVYLDVWRKFTTDGVLRIMDRQEVLDSTKVAINNDLPLGGTDWAARRAEETLFTGVYALDNGTYGKDTVYLKKTGRYPTIPTIYSDENPGFKLLVKQSQYAAKMGTTSKKTGLLNRYFAKQTAEDGKAGSLYVRRVDNNWLVYNTTQYEDKKATETQTSTANLLYNSCSSVKLTFPMYSFGVMTEKGDGIDFYLNNYRSFTDEQSTDIIVISGCASQPTYTVSERGSHAKSTVTAKYANGTYTLTVKHNGALDISVKCNGTNANRKTVPTFAKTEGCDIPNVYEGPRQYEWENADFKNVDSDWSGITKSDISGFTALGYVSWGKNANASQRDTVSIDKAGVHKLAIRYLAPDGDVRTVNLHVNGKLIASGLNFTRTSTDNEWTTVVIDDVALPAGKSEIRLVATAAAPYSLYLDNMVLTWDKVASGIDNVVSDNNIDGHVYTISGQRVNSGTLQRGIYIRNGKKFSVE